MRQKIAYGVDIGWVGQLESMGFSWVDSNKNVTDPIREAQNLGADSVRLRVFVNPPKSAFWKKPDGAECMLGFCDAANVLKMCQRADSMGMRLMIDFHYSDHFADPVYQDIPEAWRAEDGKGLAGCVAAHTEEVLTLLKDHGIYPEWVQVGNEINPGILLPAGSRKENPAALIRMLNAGYDTVKKCFPDCKVVTHVAGVLVIDVCSFYDIFFELGGRTDVLGLSYYPYWYCMIPDKKTDGESLSPRMLREEMIRLTRRYQKPVLIAEIGGPDTEEEETYLLLRETIRELNAYGEETGIFYWEPEVNAKLLPDHYPLGAARLVEKHVLQYTKALSAYRDSRQIF